jgi:hypothetical protein
MPEAESLLELRSVRRGLKGSLPATLALAAALLGCGEEERVKVPDVTDLRVLDAQRAISDAGLSSRPEPKPATPTQCKVTDQSARGMVPPETEVVLEVSCPPRLTEGED